MAWDLGDRGFAPRKRLELMWGRAEGAHGSRWAAAWGPPAVGQEAAGSGAGLREEGAGTTPGVLGCMGEGEVYAWGGGVNMHM